MLKTNIKASSIGNLSDARYFAAVEVQWLGFALSPSDEAYLAPHLAKVMKEWIEGPKLIGEFALEDSTTIAAQVTDIGLDAIQVPIFATLDLTLIHVPVFRTIVIERHTQAADLHQFLETFKSETTYFILDFSKNNITWQDLMLYEQLNIELLQRVCQQYKIWLQIDCLPKELNSILQAVQPFGLCVRGGEEESVGIKSFDVLQDWFDVLEV